MSDVKFTISALDDFSSTFDSLDGGLKSISDKADNFGKKIGDIGGGLTKGVTMPMVAGATALVGLAGGFAKTGDAIAKTSTKLGISTDAFQELDYWAGQNGLSTDSMERAVGRLNQRIGQAATGNDKYAKAFEELGVSVKDGNGNIMATEDVLGDTIAALQRIEDPALQSAMAAEVFGTKLGRDLMPALQDGSLSIEEATEKIHAMGGVMDESAVRGSENFMDSMDDLTRSFKAGFMPIATEAMQFMTNKLFPAIQDTVIPAVQEFGKKVGELVEWFSSLSPGMQKTIGITLALVAALGPVLMVAGQVISMVSTLTTVFGVLSKAILFILSPIGLKIAAILALVAAGVWLWQNWDMVASKAKEIWGSIADFFSKITSSIASYVEKNFTLVYNTISNYMTMAFGIISDIWGWIKNSFTNTLNFLKALVTGDFTGMKNAIKAQMENSRELISSIWNRIKAFFSTTLSEIWSTVKQKFSDVVNSVREKMNDAKSTISDIWNEAQSFLEDIDLFEIGKSIIDGLIKGIVSKVGAVAGAIGNIASTVTGGIKNALNINSPIKKSDVETKKDAKELGLLLAKMQAKSPQRRVVLA